MPNEIFNQIKQAAIAQDDSALKAVMRRTNGYFLVFFPITTPVYSIDLLKSESTGYVTPAEELAFEGNKEAVEFLRARGAAVENIARGFAKAGNFEEAERYHTEYGVHPNYIVGGFARGCQMDFVTEYLRKFGTVIDINFITIGYILSLAYRPQASEDITEYVEAYRLNGADVNLLAQTYARIGNLQQVERYRTEFHADVDFIAIGFAVTGNLEQVERYQTEFGASVHLIAEFFALAGNIEQAERYRTEFHADVDFIANGFASSGYLEQADRYCTEFGADPTPIAVNFALNGNLQQVERYRIKFGADPARIAQAFAQIGYHQQSEHYDTIARQGYHPAAQRNQQLPAHPNPAPIQHTQRLVTAAYSQRAPEFPIDMSTPAGRALDGFINDLKQNPIQIVEGYAYDKEEEIELCCSISQSPPKIPVTLRGRLYDLKELLLWHQKKGTDPFDNQPFTVNDLQPAKLVVVLLNKIAREHKNDQVGQPSTPSI
jgi:hypothetical protein